MSSGFIKIPRSLYEDPLWVDARPTHQTVFNTILLNVCFKQCEHNIHGNIIVLEPGQLCVTYRQLQEWCGKWISKNDVEGAIKYFIKVNFLRQEIRHGKMLLIVCESSIYEENFKPNQTTNQTEVRQKSDIKEERKERKENNNVRGVVLSADEKTIIGLDEEHLSKFEEICKKRGFATDEVLKLSLEKVNSKFQEGDLGSAYKFMEGVAMKYSPTKTSQRPEPPKSHSTPFVEDQELEEYRKNAKSA